RRLRSCAHALLVDVDSLDAAARDAGDTQGRAPGPAGDVEQASVRGEVQPADEQVVLGRSQPAVLADVLTERCTSYFGVQLRRELTVLRVVVAYSGCLRHGFRFVVAAARAVLPRVGGPRSARCSARRRRSPTAHSLTQTEDS